MSLINKYRGFTLIEAMIVLAIMGIIAVIAIPAYSDYVNNTRRRDCQGVLLSLAQAFERRFVTNATYLGGTAAGNVPNFFATQCPLEGGTKYYTLTILPVTATTYTLRATPIATSPQASNGLIELDSTGARRWDVNNNGAFEASENNWNK